MKIYNIQPSITSNTITKSSCLKNYSKCLSFQSNESNQPPKRSKLKECLIDLCIGWVTWDIIKELYHLFSNNGRPPFP